MFELILSSLTSDSTS